MLKEMQVETRIFDYEKIRASVNISCFQGQSGVAEYHLTIRPSKYAPVETQLDWIWGAYQKTLDEIGLGSQKALFRRFFCSDLANQVILLKAHPMIADESCSISLVNQPPLPDAKIALWAYHLSDPSGVLEKTCDGSTMTLRRGELQHHWTSGVSSPTENSSYNQTQEIFAQYEAFLKDREISLSENVIRTWFFTRDIDLNYAGLVKARRELFAEYGLTKDTHYIASTCVEGGAVDVAAKASMDSYAVSGVHPEQIQFLSAPEHLSPTHIYGVTFERATSISYRDRKHVFISGTASIDGRGEILYLGDVSRQTDRTLENMEALLNKAGADLDDMRQFIVYLRDPSDYAIVNRRMGERFPSAPIVIALAAVCRPGWLVEIEGVAIVPEDRPDLPSL